jgi:hypothetical protein
MEDQIFGGTILVTFRESLLIGMRLFGPWARIALLPLDTPRKKKTAKCVRTSGRSADQPLCFSYAWFEEIIACGLKRCHVSDNHFGLLQ